MEIDEEILEVAVASQVRRSVELESCGRMVTSLTVGGVCDIVFVPSTECSPETGRTVGHPEGDTWVGPDWPRSTFGVGREV